MNTISRDIPDAVKRQLRQEAGFGCCLCGCPIYDYQHIIQFAKTPHHKPEDMMVLCPNHHREATLGALPEAAQREAKAAPFNIQRGFVDGQLSITHPILAVEAGTNQFVGAGFKLLVDGTPLLTLVEDDGGRLLVSLDLYDADDNLMLSIDRNEWITGDPLPWDFEFGLRTLTLRRKSHDIALVLDARQLPLLLEGDFRRRGQHFALRPGGLTFNGVATDCGVVNLGLVCLMLVADTIKKGFFITADPQYGRGMIVSWPNPRERLERCLVAYKELTRKGTS